MNLRVAFIGEVKPLEGRSRSESERESALVGVGRRETG